MSSFDKFQHLLGGHNRLLCCKEHKNDSFGYHKKEIKRGVNGEISKIQEELDELSDAEEQNVKILMMNEVSDILGAIALYVKNKFPEMTLDDFISMSNLTHKAFEDGKR